MAIKCEFAKCFLKVHWTSMIVLYAEFKRKDIGTY